MPENQTDTRDVATRAAEKILELGEVWAAGEYPNTYWRIGNSDIRYETERDADISHRQAIAAIIRAELAERDAENKYEAELTRVCAILQRVHPLGEVMGIGLLRSASALERVVERYAERDAAVAELVEAAQHALPPLFAQSHHSLDLDDRDAFAEIHQSLKNALSRLSACSSRCWPTGNAVKGVSDGRPDTRNPFNRNDRIVRQEG